MNKINVLFVTHSKKKGGAEQSLIHLINHLDTSEYNVFLVCPNGTEYLDEIAVPFKEINLSLESIKHKLGLHYLITVFKLRKIVKKNKIDIVHANGWRAPWYVAPLRMITKSKTIWHHRDRFDSNFYNYLLPYFFHKIICISNFVKSTISARHSGKCDVIYNGVNLNDRVEPDYEKVFKVNKKIRIGTFGRIVEWKRYEEIIEAVNIVNKNIGNNWELVIVGDTSIDGSKDYFKKLQDLVKEYRITKNVIFYGYTKFPLELMKQCDITVNFSDKEPFGRVIIESLIVKTPVIVANSGGAPEIINITTGGSIIKECDAKGLAKEIEKYYLMDQREYFEICQRGYGNACEMFNMSKLVLEVSQLYKSLQA
ncbi:glycosyltransferase family 4 protein [Neobacillus mesonae]|uniref:glycosyltransferase family 4 protein n=1 Tax=Neobacillus mesonae TaxID=1193713 RepID=UPI00203F5278|nr:glycosyltransferase family 4 protein [Neobacillus mesonae]MCM3569380.1 glycosyltransferase family 4 protein [Neobacillus mesonae]